jgi:hypothetical protein
VWDPVPYHAIRFMDGDGADVKFPWELSRLYWIAWLGKAYWISGNGAWSRELVRQIDSWREANPVNVGVNWVMPMEVGIRAFWLAMGFGLFHGAPGIDAAWWTDYLRLAWSHGTYLESNLEYFSNLTNHYIANCFGLVAVGVLFATTAKGRAWMQEGRRRLEKEIEHQVLADGTHHERSLPYHRLVTEMYLVAMVLLERAGEPFGATARDAVGRMSELLCDVMAPDGSVPQIGDADDGVILRTTQDGDPYDARDVAAIAAVLFDRPEMKAAAGRFGQGAILLLGGAGYETFERISPSAPRPSRLYRDGGFAVLRSHAMSVVADVGVIGLHGNNDTLSFVLSDAIGPIVIDPGTYCYTRNPSLRNELRATTAHNAPCLDRMEIAEFDGLWRVRREIPTPEIHAWDVRPTGGELVASHRAYGARGAVRRRWDLDGDLLVVEDTIAGAASHTVSSRFTLHPSIGVRVVGPHELAFERSGVAIGTVTSSAPLADAVVRDAWYSPGYGVAARTTVVHIDLRVDAPGAIQYIWRLSSTP